MPPAALDLFTCPFMVDRYDLLAGIPTPIIPPMTCSSVAISNMTADDLAVLTTPDGTKYFVLPSCFERDIELSQSGSATALFRKGQVNFYLQAVEAGTVVLLWT